MKLLGCIEPFEHLQRWTLPTCYAGAHWDQWYRFLGKHRDSDELTESNYACGLEQVKAAMQPGLICDDEMQSVQEVRETHWAVGWVEWIAIHESDVLALQCADQILARLDNYPVLNENDFSERENESANTIWRDCYNEKERVKYVREHRSQFYFHSWREMLEVIRGQYFNGYASELIH